MVSHEYVGTITTGDETSDHFLRLSLGSALSNLFLSPRFDAIEDLLKDRATAERVFNHYLNPSHLNKTLIHASTVCFQ